MNPIVSKNDPSNHNIPYYFYTFNSITVRICMYNTISLFLDKNHRPLYLFNYVTNKKINKEG